MSRWIPGIHRLGDDVVVLRSVERHVDASHLAQLSGPHPAAVDHVLGRRWSRCSGRDTPVTRPLFFWMNPVTGDVFDQIRTPPMRAPLASEICDVDGICSAIIGGVEAARGCPSVSKRGHIFCDLGASRSSSTSISNPRTKVRNAAQTCPPVRRIAGDLQVAHIAEAGVLASLFPQHSCKDRGCTWTC